MPATPEDLFATLDRLGIRHSTVSHPPLFTVEQLAADCWPEDQHAAINLPDPVKGENIVLLTTHRGADRHELVVIAHREGLGELYIPRQVLVVREIPLLGSGKPDYSGARRLAETLGATGTDGSRTV